MKPIEPMLAESLDKAKIDIWSDWWLERKWDGERRVVAVFNGQAKSWTRPRKHKGAAAKDMKETPLPAHLAEDLVRRVPDLTMLDTEMLNGTTSTDVRRKDLRGQERLVVFDVLMFKGSQITDLSNTERRRMLLHLFMDGALGNWIDLSLKYDLTCQEDVAKHCEHIWATGGEGVMLKRAAAKYSVGKRRRDWIKIKKEQPGTGVVIGFEATRGEVLNHGKFAVVVLELPNGKQTKVKSLDDATRAEFERKWEEWLAANPGKDDLQLWHPDIGRTLRFTFNDYTPKGGVRHPKWDRWEDE